MVVELGGETEDEARGRAEALLEELRPGATGGRLVEGDDARRRARAGARGRARDRRVPEAARTTGRAGRTRRCRPSGSATTSATCARSRPGTASGASTTATSARAACTSATTSTSRAATGSRATGASSRRRPTSSSPTAARSRASTATGRRAPSCSRACSARSSCRRSASSSAIWDPDGRMNPGKVVDPRPLDADLKLGAPDGQAAVAFAYPQDHGELGHADDPLRRRRQLPQARRHGRDVPELRRDARGDAHDPRPRAAAARDARRRAGHRRLALARRCSRRSTSASPARAARRTARPGSTCPCYKAEFLHHHYKGRLAAAPRVRLRADRPGGAGGRVRAGAREPRGADRGRSRPRPGSRRSARCPGSRRSRSRPGSRPRRHANPGGERVLLFPDTFSNRFHTHVGRAAVEALEAAGFAVELPEGHVCCGRPLYDYGFLGLARRYLRRMLARLRPWLDEGVPVVGLEPSCVAVFRDELPKLMPGPAAEQARKASSTSASCCATAGSSRRGSSGAPCSGATATRRRPAASTRTRSSCARWASRSSR